MIFTNNCPLTVFSLAHLKEIFTHDVVMYTLPSLSVLFSLSPSLTLLLMLFSSLSLSLPQLLSLSQLFSLSPNSFLPSKQNAQRKSFMFLYTSTLSYPAKNPVVLFQLFQQYLQAIISFVSKLRLKSNASLSRMCSHLFVVASARHTPLVKIWYGTQYTPITLS